LHEAVTRHYAVVDEVPERRAVRPLDPREARRRIGVRIELDHRQTPAVVSLCNRGDSRERDRVVASQDDRDRTGRDHFLDGGAYRTMTGMRVAGHHLGVAVVDDRELRERIDPQVEVPAPWRSAPVVRVADRSGTEPGPGPVRDHVVHRRTHDRDVGAGQLARVESKRNLLERPEARVCGLAGTMGLHTRILAGRRPFAPLRPWGTSPPHLCGTWPI
jgi:hypothetical protein